MRRCCSRSSSAVIRRASPCACCSESHVTISRHFGSLTTLWLTGSAKGRTFLSGMATQTGAGPLAGRLVRGSRARATEPPKAARAPPAYMTALARGTPLREYRRRKASQASTAPRVSDYSEKMLSKRKGSHIVNISHRCNRKHSPTSETAARSQYVSGMGRGDHVPPTESRRLRQRRSEPHRAGGVHRRDGARNALRARGAGVAAKKASTLADTAQSQGRLRAGRGRRLLLRDEIDYSHSTSA